MNSTLNKLKKYLYIGAALFSFVLGGIGLIVPLLPTTPFWLLTTYLLVRSSPTLYEQMMRLPIFGAHIRNYHEQKAIVLHGKIISICTLWIGISFAIYYTPELWVRLILGTIAIGVTLHIFSFKTLRK